MAASKVGTAARAAAGVEDERACLHGQWSPASPLGGDRVDHLAHLGDDARRETHAKVPVAIERKLAWLDSLIEHLRERDAAETPAILCADFNVTPAPIDAYHYWEGTSETKSRTGFREDEREMTLCSGTP